MKAYESLKKTLAYARKDAKGYIRFPTLDYVQWLNPFYRGIDPLLGQINNIFYTLYQKSGDSKFSPILPSPNISIDKYLANIANIKSSSQNEDKKQCLNAYMLHLGQCITQLMLMSHEQWDTTFATHQKNNTIKRLKTLYNQLSDQWGCDYWFRKISLETVKDNKSKLKPVFTKTRTPLHFTIPKDREPNTEEIQLGKDRESNTEEIQLGKDREPNTKKIHLGKDGSIYYALMKKSQDDFSSKQNYEAYIQQKKISRENKWQSLWFGIIIAACIVSGRAAVAIYATVGMMTVIVGVSAVLANFPLFLRDSSIFRKRLDDIISMFTWSIAGFCMSVYSGLALGCAWFNASLGYHSLLSLFHINLVAPALSAPFIFSTIVFITLFIGVTALLFLPAYFAIRYLQKNSVSGLWRDLKNGARNYFWEAPPYNIKTEEKVEWVPHPNLHIGAKRIAHDARHCLKSVLAIFVLLPFALVFTVLGTRSLIQKSSVDAFVLFVHTFSLSKVAALQTVNTIWWIALIPSGTLALRNLVLGALYFADTISNIIVSVLYGFAAGIYLLFNPTCWYSAGEALFNSGFHYKTTLNIARTIFATMFFACVGFVGYGVGQALGPHGFASVPLWMNQIATAIFAVFMRLIAVLNLLTVVPIRWFKQGNGGNVANNIETSYQLIIEPLGGGVEQQSAGEFLKSQVFKLSESDGQLLIFKGNKLDPSTSDTSSSTCELTFGSD